MSELLTPAVAGAVAGLGVAMPMGAMSVLLLQEAIRHRRVAVAAAAGIAVADLGYAALATALGPWVAAHLTPVEAWVRLASAGVLLAIAAQGLHRSRPRTEPPGETATPDAVHDRSWYGADPQAGTAPRDAGGIRGDDEAQEAGGIRGDDAAGDGNAPRAERLASGPGPGRAFVRYVGLTAVNPTTALYFAALTTAQGAGLRAGAAGTAFLTGVALASLLWQQTLVVIGAFAGSRISDTTRTWTFRLGYGLVAAYALKIVFPLPAL